MRFPDSTREPDSQELDAGQDSVRPGIRSKTGSESGVKPGVENSHGEIPRSKIYHRLPSSRVERPLSPERLLWTEVTARGYSLHPKGNISMSKGIGITCVPSPVLGWSSRVCSKQLALIALGAMMLSVGACSGFPMKIDPSELARFKDSPKIVAGHYKSEKLVIHSIKAALLGKFGISPDPYELGAQVASRYALDDPSVELKTHFIGSISSKLGLGTVEIIPEALSPPTPEGELMLSNKYPDALFFEFQMVKTEFALEGLNLSRYVLVYRGSAALYKYSETRYLWKSLCEGIYENPSQSPTFDDLTVNQGQVLKQMVSEATKACANELVEHFLSVETASKGTVEP